MTFFYDDQGKVTDVTTEGALVASAAAPIKQMLTHGTLTLSSDLVR